MTDAQPGNPSAEPPGVEHSERVEPAAIERGELVETGGAGDVTAVAAAGQEGDAVTSPAKVMRIGSMVKMLLEEVRTAPLDEPSRERLAEIYERSVTELTEALSPDLQDELRNLALPFRDGVAPSDAEIRVAKAQLVGWLEGLFHGIQATLFAQQLAARQQLEQMRQLPGGPMPGGQVPGGEVPGGQVPGADRPGTYL